MRCIEKFSVFAVITLLLCCGHAKAQPDQGAFPQKPIRLIVGHWRTGSSAIFSRLMQPKLAAALGQEVTVDYVEGGIGGANGARATKASAPDGHTIFMGTVGVISMLSSTYKAYGVEPLKDFVPIIKISDYPNALVAHRSVPANSFSELIALAKARPAEVTYVLISASSIHNLEMAALMREAGIQLKGIPESKGSGSAMNSIVEGNVNLVMTTAPYVLPHVRSGAIKALAIASDQRYFAFPGVPTFKEVGVPSVPIGSWMGLFAPAGTPRAIVDKLFAAAKSAAEDPEVKRIAADEGMIVSTSKSPDEFRRFVEGDTARVIATVKALGIKPLEAN